MAAGGQDTIDGGEGSDRLSGADGDDTITGGLGVDSLFGDGEFTSLSGHGNDTLKAQDGEVDRLSCEFGADTVVADANDVFDVLGDCESRTIDPGPTPPPGPDPLPPPPSVPLTAKLGAPSGTKLGLLACGKPMKFRMTFSGPCRVVAGIVVKKAGAKRLKLGTKETTIAAKASNAPSAGTFQGTLTIKKKLRAKLRRAAKATVFLAIGCVGPDGSVLAEAPASKVVLRRWCGSGRAAAATRGSTRSQLRAVAPHLAAGEVAESARGANAPRARGGPDLRATRCGR